MKFIGFLFFCMLMNMLADARSIQEGDDLYREPVAMPYWPFSSSDFWSYVEYFRALGAYDRIDEMARALFAQLHRLETRAVVYCVVIVGCLLREVLEAASLQSNFIRKGFLAVHHKYECKPANCIKACLNAVAAARILHEFLHLDACWKLILVQLCTLWVTVYPFWM
ncbi:Otospiralin [Anas platyrhynchos]|uniref:Otospiralin n=1 Tax=Anas platyrhynchos TaxID=8839 RepID=R0KNC8_ANAPL|nr:Otospiralin [Anas platyrhynchos]